MFNYIVKRLLLMLPTLFGVLLITFAVTQFVPGGPVEQVVAQMQDRSSGGEAASASSSNYRGRQGVSAEQLGEIKKLYGFDKPVAERFWIMLKSYATFDLGKSFYHHKDVWELIKEKLPGNPSPPGSTRYEIHACKAPRFHSSLWPGRW